MRSLPRLFAAALTVIITAGLQAEPKVGPDDSSLQAAAARPAGRSDEGVDRRGRDRIVIGHRGASGDRQEHTIEAYWLAIQEGADFSAAEFPRRHGPWTSRGPAGRDERFLELGIDGYFTDHPGIGFAALDAFEENR